MDNYNSEGKWWNVRNTNNIYNSSNASINNNNYYYRNHNRNLNNNLNRNYNRNHNKNTLRNHHNNNNNNNKRAFVNKTSCNNKHSNANKRGVHLKQIDKNKEHNFHGPYKKKRNKQNHWGPVNKEHLYIPKKSSSELVPFKNTNCMRFASHNLIKKRNHQVIGNFASVDNTKKRWNVKLLEKRKVRNMPSPLEMMNSHVGFSIVKKLSSVYKASGIFISRICIDNTENKNKNENKRNWNIQVLLGIDPLKRENDSPAVAGYHKKEMSVKRECDDVNKKHENDTNDKEESVIGFSQTGGELNILGGKKIYNVEKYAYETAFREFSEEILFAYNIFLSFFNYPYYTTRSFLKEEDIEKENFAKYPEFLRDHFMSDISKLKKEEIEKTLEIHITNFLFFFKEIGLNLSIYANNVLQYSYPPTKHKQNLEDLENIHKSINVYSMYFPEKKKKFYDYYYHEGKYIVHFFNVTKPKCITMLDHLNNYFWNNCINIFQMVLMENLDMLQKVRAKGKTYVVSDFDSNEIKKFIEKEFYDRVMDSGPKKPSTEESQTDAIEVEDRAKTFYEISRTTQSVEEGFMNGLCWVDLSNIILFFLKSTQGLQRSNIIRNLKHFFKSVNAHIQKEEKIPMKYTSVIQSLEIPYELCEHIINLYSEEVRNQIIENSELSENELLILLFSPFNTKLNISNYTNSMDNFKMKTRKFFSLLIHRLEFWIFCYLNFVSMIEH